MSSGRVRAVQAPLSIGAVLFGVGVIAMWAIGPSVQPYVPPGPALDATDLWVGVAAGVALVVVWASALILQRRTRLSDNAAVALLGAAGYAAFALGLFGANVLHGLGESAGLPGAISGEWVYGALLAGLLAGVVVPACLGGLLALAGLAPGRAVAPGVAAGAAGVFLSVLLYVWLYDALVH